MISMHSKIVRCFASKMQAGSTKNRKDSAGRRLGVKKLGGNEVQPGDIIARQRGLKWHPGANTYLGKDHSIHSQIEGYVQFERSRRSFKLKKKKYIMHVLPMETANRVRRPAPYQYHPELFPDRAENNPAFANLNVYHPAAKEVPKMTIMGRGKLVENPKYAARPEVTNDMIPVREIPQTVSDQILHRIKNKVSKLLDEDIVLGEDKDSSLTSKMWSNATKN